MASEPITMREMIDAIVYEAVRNRGSQTALIEAGWRKEADPQVTRRIAALDAATYILAQIEPHLDEVKRMVASRNRRANT